MMTYPPFLSPPLGPNAQRARFLMEVAGALEVMASYHSLPAERQRAWAEMFVADAASVAESEVLRRGKRP